MCPRVSLKLVAACEPLSTEDPVTYERPLPRVQAHVSPEQGRLPERLHAAGEVADVLPLAHLRWPEWRHTAMGSRPR